MHILQRGQWCLKDSTKKLVGSDLDSSSLLISKYSIHVSEKRDQENILSEVIAEIFEAEKV